MPTRLSRASAPEPRPAIVETRDESNASTPDEAGPPARVVQRDGVPEAGPDAPARPRVSAKPLGGRPQFLSRFLRSLVPRPDLTKGTGSRPAALVVSLCRALLSQRGEASGRQLATEVLAAYRQLDDEARGAFFDLLVDEFSPAPNVVSSAADAYKADPSQANLLALERAVEPRRQELFRRLNMAHDGTAALVSLRTELLRTVGAHPKRRAVDADLVHLFKSWFNRGFLTLQRIDWRTSAVILERLIQYEAVHQIQGWADLRRRLEADRRCYAFFHHALPDEPLIFIEVALTRGMTGQVQPLLDIASPVVDPARADSAIFYSITNCQEGLRGVSFGNLLIKQVVEDLGQSFRRIRQFATLSPIPGFRAWLHSSGSLQNADPIVRTFVSNAIDSGSIGTTPVPADVSQALSRLCARYLVHAKDGKAPLDPVARFHLANGARLERLNWAGDISETGVRRSLGFTVNYVYRLADVERNHEAYANDCQVIASRWFQRMAS